MFNRQSLIAGLLVTLLSLTQLQASEDGITFSDKSWEEVQQEAKAQNKYIFVDAFAVWCGPCKWMEKNIFTQETVGEFYNENFISLQFDMEKGDGPEFAKTYGVRAYPTFLYFDPDGNLVHRAVGGRDADAFIDVAQAALDPDRQSETMRLRYEEGDRDPDFLYNYTLMLAGSNQSADEALETYLDTQEEADLMNEKNWQLIQKVGQSTSLDIFDFVVENQDAYQEEFGVEEVYNYLSGALQQDIVAATRSQNTEQLEAIKSRIKEVMGESAKSMLAQADFLFHSIDPEKAFPYAKTYFDNYVESAGELNQVAWYYYENTKDPEMLKKALEWADKSVSIEASYNNLDTKAHLQYAVGNKKDALQTAEKAIEMGKAAGQDVSTTEALVEKARVKH